MKKIFREYHQFTDKEFQKIWKEGLFVFDTNTLLNMYRYSRKTVDAYFDVLKGLKKSSQLWIPHQVGFEFYENRINVISEYEKSYDEMQSILNKAKTDIESRYKDHPFLNLSDIKKDMDSGLSAVELKLKKAKADHPKWLEEDDVLTKLNELFDGSVGTGYTEERLCEIKKEGKERYEKKTPPGFKDDKKSEDKKYGDLILWYQIIENAKQAKKPVILVSGDVKEDWWLEKDGKKLMPLPQLKKELFDKAGVSFHIYTSDRFLELSGTKEKKIDDSTIKEVRKIRELEEKRMMSRRSELPEKEYYSRSPYRHVSEFVSIIPLLEEIILILRSVDIPPPYRSDLEQSMQNLLETRHRMAHGEVDKLGLYRLGREVSFVVGRFLALGLVDPEPSAKLKELLDRVEYSNHRMQRYL
ncbi:MAG: PIN domain-containing protein [Candidatus Paceibacterota bacterium]|jgi:hypothetical protein